MMYAAGSQPLVPMVSAFSVYGPLGLLAAIPASGVWADSANDAIYVPVVLPSGGVIRRVWWVNGASVSASYNIDCGVYADAGYKPGRRLVSSGSTAQGTATQVQFVNVTDTSFGPGLYWIALACSSTSATLFRYQYVSAAGSARFREASALPLPTSATPADSALEMVYLCGFATTASP